MLLINGLQILMNSCDINTTMGMFFYNLLLMDKYLKEIYFGPFNNLVSGNGK